MRVDHGVRHIAVTREEADRRPTSFDELYRSESSGLLRLAFLLVTDRESAADVVQEAFTEAAARWDVIGGYDRPDLWLRRVVIHRATSRRRRRWSEQRALRRVATQRVVEHADGGEPIDPGAWRHVVGLPPQQRTALALVYGCDLSLAEAALVMECSVGSVKTHLHRGRLAVLSRVEDRP